MTDEVRYKVFKDSLWWRVKIGNGQQMVGRCYSETEAQRLAAALHTAYLDGQFVMRERAAAEAYLSRYPGFRIGAEISKLEPE